MKVQYLVIIVIVKDYKKSVFIILFKKRLKLLSVNKLLRTWKTANNLVGT